MWEPNDKLRPIIQLPYILFLQGFSVEVLAAAAVLIVKMMKREATVDKILYKDSSTVNNVRSVHKVCTQNLELF